MEDKKILIYLLDNGKISKKETLNIIGYGGTKTKEILNELIEKNLIVRRMTECENTKKKNDNIMYKSHW